MVPLPNNEFKTEITSVGVYREPLAGLGNSGVFLTAAYGEQARRVVTRGEVRLVFVAIVASLPLAASAFSLTYD